MMLRTGLNPRCFVFLLGCHPESNLGGVSQKPLDTPLKSTPSAMLTLRKVLSAPLASALMY